MFCSVKVNCTWYRKLPDPDMADTRTSMEATSSQTPGAALALTAGTLPQDHQRGTEANNPYTPRLTKLPESWRHRDRTTGAHWVWVEASVTREPGWYTQEAGRWRRYTGYDATLPSAPGHEQARAGQSGIHYDSLTGSFWTWYDAGMDYQAGWWMKAEDVWIKYDPAADPRPVATGSSPHRTAGQQQERVTIHLVIHDRAAGMRHMAPDRPAPISTQAPQPQGADWWHGIDVANQAALPMWTGYPVLPTWEMAGFLAAQAQLRDAQAGAQAQHEQHHQE